MRVRTKHCNGKRADCPTPVAAAAYSVRTALNITQAEMGQRLGYTAAAGQKAVQFIEHGMSPTLIVLLRLGALARGNDRKTLIEAARKHLKEHSVIDILRDVARSTAA